MISRKDSVNITTEEIHDNNEDSDGEDGIQDDDESHATGDQGLSLHCHHDWS